jgi:hypothetical protein
MAKVGTRFYHDDIEFWAENGLIYVEDHRDDTFNAITIKDALQRAACLSVEARRIKAKGALAAEDRKHLLDCIDNKVIDDLRKQRKKNILLPGPNAGGKKEILLPNGEVAGPSPKKGSLWMP